MTVIFHMSKNQVIVTLIETLFFSQDMCDHLFGLGERALKIVQSY